MDFTTVKRNLENRGYLVHVFASGQEAAAYLDGALDGKDVGCGGSMTLNALGIPAMLEKHNRVFGLSDRREAMNANVYLTSANALAETGEMINIDNTGNRTASTLYGHEKVYFVIGRNKLAPTLEDALWRARNIAGPKNAQHLGRKTPCAVKGDHCYDCRSPERICRCLVILWEPMNRMEAEVLLIDEELGF
ncbi:MAG: LUD domain-containing protein [Oscillibacter sp.]|nr:LUD domain-containing protein [Oscillibacter sp.]